MKCNHCEKFYNNKTEQRVLHFTHGIILVQFCCYECYLAFWKDVKGFVPLPEFVPEPNPVLYVPEPVKKKRIQLNRHISYKKNAYCF